MLMIPHCLHNRLTDGDEVVSLTHRRRSTLQIYLYFCLWYSFLLGPEYTPEPKVAGRIRHIDNNNSVDLSRTRDLPACNVVPYPLRYAPPSITFSCVSLHSSSPGICNWCAAATHRCDVKGPTVCQWTLRRRTQRSEEDSQGINEIIEKNFRNVVHFP
jgi:hypothetical protein